MSGYVFTEEDTAILRDTLDLSALLATGIHYTSENAETPPLKQFAAAHRSVERLLEGVIQRAHFDRNAQSIEDLPAGVEVHQ